MTVVDELQTAFEAAGYRVSEATQNRNRVRIAVADDEASANTLRTTVTETLGEEAVLGLDVTTDTGGDEATIGTVVSFQYRG
jgi:hypothetical protein